MSSSRELGSYERSRPLEPLDVLCGRYYQAVPLHEVANRIMKLKDST
ncbi:hypothetical protein [Pseudomonas duriflava]|nr:hypothetical protein [Pseudomonas duriflava]